MKSFWDTIGAGLAKVAHALAFGAIWASKNPAVITTIASISGHPEIGVAITTASGITTAIVTKKAS